MWKVEEPRAVAACCKYCNSLCSDVSDKSQAGGPHKKQRVSQSDSPPPGSVVLPQDADMAPPDADVAPLDADVAFLNAFLMFLGADVASLDADVASLDADVASLANDEGGVICGNFPPAPVSDIQSSETEEHVSLSQISITSAFAELSDMTSLLSGMDVVEVDSSQVASLVATSSHLTPRNELVEEGTNPVGQHAAWCFDPTMETRQPAVVLLLDRAPVCVSKQSTASHTRHDALDLRV